MAFDDHIPPQHGGLLLLFPCGNDGCKTGGTVGGFLSGSVGLEEIFRQIAEKIDIDERTTSIVPDDFTCSPVRMCVKACSTLVESNADVSMKDKLFCSKK